MFSNAGSTILTPPFQIEYFFKKFMHCICIIEANFDVCWVLPEIWDNWLPG